MIATSPARFDGRDAADTGGVPLMSQIRDQGPCLACTAFALVAAGEAAVSAVLRKSAAGRLWSVQDLHFCSGTGDGAEFEVRACRSSAMTAQEATRAFVNAVSRKGLVVERCLPYDAPSKPVNEDLCSYRCREKDPDLPLGKFKYIQLTSAWEVQAHIRQWGAVFTRLDVWSNLRPFYKDNPQGTYMGPDKDSTRLESHAVLLVGYDNKQERWLFRNSWGKGAWAHAPGGACHGAASGGVDSRLPLPRLAHGAGQRRLGRRHKDEHAHLCTHARTRTPTHLHTHNTHSGRKPSTCANTRSQQAGAWTATAGCPTPPPPPESRHPVTPLASSSSRPTRRRCPTRRRPMSRARAAGGSSHRKGPICRQWRLRWVS
ncbi:MAG: hypothetical protein J3K34DRAFT_409538 [Monoraphidium minutum]|nr:MAG: hypothetical protein J3K34DRAFT_409538 [Monoraphidium minutum]